MTTEDKMKAYRATALSNSPTFHFPDHQQKYICTPDSSASYATELIGVDEKGKVDCPSGASKSKSFVL